VRGLRRIHSGDASAVALDESAAHRHRIRGHRLRDSEFGILLPLVEILPLGALADLPVPFGVAIRIGSHAMYFFTFVASDFNASRSSSSSASSGWPARIVFSCS
jgi:hypothetical protein